MGRSNSDGGAGDADYGVIGQDYSKFRRPDPRIAHQIREALGPARTVLNVGAGAGSYEPADVEVTAVEPSAAMRAQRPARLTPAIDARAERLPFPDDSFDAAMSIFSVHQWSDLDAGLRELKRSTRGPVVIMTCDPEALDRNWLNEYAPEVLAVEAGRYPPLQRIADRLGGHVEIAPVLIPLDCCDGFNEAYYGRPERLLEPGARQACSSWSFVATAVVDRFVESLGRDLASGAWDRRFGALRDQSWFDGSLRLVVSR